jgi:hypothetical protein
MSKLSAFSYGLFSGAIIIPQFFNDKSDFTTEYYNFYKLGAIVSNLAIFIFGYYTIVV